MRAFYNEASDVFSLYLTSRVPEEVPTQIFEPTDQIKIHCYADDVPCIIKINQASTQIDDFWNLKFQSISHKDLTTGDGIAGLIHIGKDETHNKRSRMVEATDAIRRQWLLERVDQMIQSDDLFRDAVREYINDYDRGISTD